MTYQTDRTWSDHYIPAIKRIVGPHLLCESPLEVDQGQAADLILLRARDMMIACRMRRPGYAEQYGNQFTIRRSRDSGATTELRKIIDGFGDWMFYGHAVDESDYDTINPWYLIDLNAFRSHLITRTVRTHGRGRNPSDGTDFSWFDIPSFGRSPPLLIASSNTERVVA